MNYTRQAYIAKYDVKEEEEASASRVATFPSRRFKGKQLNECCVLLLHRKSAHSYSHHEKYRHRGVSRVGLKGGFQKSQI